MKHTYIATPTSPNLAEEQLYKTTKAAEAKS